MALRQNTSEDFDQLTPTLLEQEWPISRYQYSPPRAVTQYASRALPPRPQSSSSRYDFEEDHSGQHTPQHYMVTIGVDPDIKADAFIGAMNEETFKTSYPPQIAASAHFHSSHTPPLVSPRPRRPDSKLLSMWSTGDELVSPIDSPGTGHWSIHVVSPLSESSQRGPPSAHYESWFDDTSSDEEDPPSPPYQTPGTDQISDDAFRETPRPLTRRVSQRYSDPGSPVGTSLDAGWYGGPGSTTDSFDNLSGRRTVQPQMYTQSIDSNDGQGLIQDGDGLTFAVSKIGTFSSNRARNSQRPTPSPLNLGKQPVQRSYIGTPVLVRANSTSSHRSASGIEEGGAKLQKRRSRLGNLGSALRPLTPTRRKPPPGFTEIISQLDKQGAVSPVPKVRSVLSKAKRGLGISSNESRKERGLDDITRPTRRNAD